MPIEESKKGTKTVLAIQSLDGFIRLDLGKGCIAKLRAADWYQAIADGKAEARALTQARRERQRQADEEAHRLAWIE